ncbi:MAG: 5'/3'-nucleotidase SurE, partial [Sulfurimonas sp.]|nr:5'/3'-nucleotidase SurE [Sulfurimonas sp.]
REGSFPLPQREFLNVNIPADVSEAKMQVSYAGYRFYANDSHVHRNPRGEEHYWLGLHPLNFSPRDGVNGMSDYEAIEAGFISITPIQLDMSAYKSMKDLQEWID